MLISFNYGFHSIFTHRFFRHLFAALCLTPTLFGCDTPGNIAKLYDATPYTQGNGFWGEHYFDGFRDEKIRENRYKIQAGGNRVTSAKRTKNIALARAAEIGQDLGFSHFKIVEENTSMFCTGLRSAGSSRGYAYASQPRVTIFVDYSNEKKDSSYKNVEEISKALMPALRNRSFPQEQEEAIIRNNEKRCVGVF